MEINKKEESDCEIVENDPLCFWQASSTTTTENFRKINEIALIKAMHNKPGLWDPNDINYMNKFFKNLLWQSVLSELSMEHNNINLARVRKKWEYMRNSYRNVKLKPNESRGSACGNKYKHRLSFLDKTIMPTNTASAVAKRTEVPVLDDSSNEPSVYNYAAASPKMIVETPPLEERHERKNDTVSVVERYDKHETPRRRTAQDAFYDMLGDMMNDLPEPRKHDIRLKLLKYAGELCYDRQ